MIAPTSIPQPIAPIVQTQLPLDALRVDNVQLPQVPEPAKLFPSAAEKEANAKSGQTSETEQSIQYKSTTNQQKIDASEQKSSSDAEKNSQQNSKLDPEEQQLIRQLSSRDREVRAHERAHSSVGGQFAGAPQLAFERGPNGVQYAVSGEVSISTSEITGDPAATLAKLETVIRAALAPAEPSSQDIRVAASAAAALQRLRSSLNAEATATSTVEKDKSSGETEQTAKPTAQQRLEKLIEGSGALTSENGDNLLTVSV
jgi:hypothetical protein